MVVHGDGGEFAGVVLFGERGNDSCDGFGFIARGNDGGNARPMLRSRQDGVVGVGFPDTPETAPEEKEDEPDGQAEKGENLGESREWHFWC